MNISLTNWNTLGVPAIPGNRDFRLLRALFVALLLLCITYVWPFVQTDFVRLDQGLMLTLNFQGPAFLDSFLYSFSQLKTWVPAAVVVLGSLLLRNRRRLTPIIIYILALVLLLVVSDQLSSSVIKPLACRLRPSHDPLLAPLLHYVNGYHGGRYGFVSGHATNITALITWLFAYYRDRLSRWSLAIFGVLMCYSRIYLGVHYPGDILCGALLGFALAGSLYRLLSRYTALPQDGKMHPEVPLALALSLLVLGFVSGLGECMG